MDRWHPRIEPSGQEKMLLKRLTRVRALFGFLRLHRHEIFDDDFQERLEAVYRDTGAGALPHPPALPCMVTLLQEYGGASDAATVELAKVDLRWQMVLDCLGCETPPFSQGALQTFRERMVAHELDRLLLERTAQLVRIGAVTQGQQQLVSKAVRVAIDSRPLAGAGRVEDTLNLLGHAARSIVRLVSKLTEIEPEDIYRKAGIPLLLGPRIKAGLDINWSDPKQKAMAVETAERQVSSLERWVEHHLDDSFHKPLQPHIDALARVSEGNQTAAPMLRTRGRGNRACSALCYRDCWLAQLWGVSSDSRRRGHPRSSLSITSTR